jgi:hypothetical protein
MSIDNSKKSPRLLQSRRYTHDTFTDAQEAFTSVLDINSDEVYIDQNLIPSSSIPYGTSGDNLSVYSSGGQQVMKYYYRYKMTKSSTNSEVWFFTTGTTAGIDAQLIESNQQKNFISPKYSIPSLSTANAEDATPGYGVKVFVSTNSSSPSAGDQISSTKFVFDYKTGVLQFVLTADAPTVSQYVYISAYQYVGRALSTGLTTLTSNNTSLSSSVATTTSALSSSIGSLSSSVASINNTQNGRLDSLETASGSIRSDFNTFTSSYNTGSFTGSFKGDGSQLYNIPSSGITGLSLFQIASGSATASISPNNGLVVNTNTTITGSLNVSGIITAKEIHSSIVTSSVLYESGSTKFGDTADDTHSFTGSVLIDGLLNVNRIAPLSGSNVRIESSNLVVPNGGIFTSFNILSSGSVSASAFSGSALGLINVPFQISGSDVEGNTYNKQFTKLQFDDSTGLNVSESVPGTAFVSIGSHFKDIFVSGSPILSATGSDAFEIIPTGGVEITTSITDTNGNGYVKELNISTTTLSSSLNNRMDTITGSITTLSGSVNSLNTFTSSVVLTSQTSSMNVLSASYALTAAFALNAGAGGGSNSVTNGAYAVLNQTTPATTWTFKHSLGQRYPIFQVFDSNGVVILPSQITTIDIDNATITFPSNQTGKVIASLGTGPGGLSQYFSSNATWSLEHNLNSDYPIVTIWDTNRSIIFPQKIESIDTNNIRIYFSTPVAGYVNVAKGGHIISGSVSAGSIDYVGSNIVSGSSQILITGTTGYSTFSGSISSSIGSLSSSVATTTLVLSSSILSLSSSVATTTSGLSSSIGSLSSSVATTTNTLSSSVATTTNNLSSSISSSIGSLSSSVASIDNTQNGRLDSLETASGSIRTNFNTFTSSYNTGSFTGSFKGDGTNLYNIPASGVTGLELYKIVSGSVSASISPNNGFRVNTDVYIDGILTAKEIHTDYVTSSVLYQSGSTKFGDTSDDNHLFTGSVLVDGKVNASSLTGSINFNNLTNVPTLVSSSSQIDITGTTGYSTFSSSISTSIGSLSSSVATTTSGLSSSIGSLSSSVSTSIGSLSSSVATTTLNLKNRVDSIEGITGSISSLNTYTGSNNTVIGTLQTATGSLNTFTSSAGGRLDSLESASSSIRTTLNSYTSSNDSTNTTQNSRLTSIEGITGSISSLNSFTASINTTIKNKLDSENVVSGSSQIIYSGLTGIPSGIVSGSIQVELTGTTGYSTFSSSISTSIGALSSSIATTTLGTKNRVDSIESKTGSYATTGSNVFIGNQNINGNLSVTGSSNITGDLTVQGNLIAQQYIVSSSVTYLTTSFSSGSTKFGDTSDDTHEFTGSVLVNGKVNASSLTGSLNFNNLTNVPTLVSGSSQIIYSGLTGIPSDIVSGSSQLTGSYDTRYVLSGSITQTTWDNIASKPPGIISGSVQIINLGFATTSSNDFYGNRFLYTNSSATGSWVISHYLGYQYPNVDIYDSSNQILIPQTITAVSENTMQIDFATPTAGKAILTTGGARSTGLFVETGSYYNATTNIGITGSLVVTGDVDGNSFNTTSDRKLKTNLVRIENALDKIEKLNGYTFDWLEEYSEDRTRQIGMVADEVYEVQPELISHRNIVLSNKEEKIKLLDYSKVTAILIEAIKELNDKVTKLENKRKKK